jgi:hypothetical protein
MNFKNDLEQRSFQIAERVLGGGVTIEHNKTIQIEAALFPEVASFKGPPAKEIDVLVAELLDDPKIMLLVSCKLLSRRAEPAHVQEWGAVVQTMNRYSEGTHYFGLVVSPTGFTSGCEAWATSHNLGIVPPLKGRRVAFVEETVFRMLERVLLALRSRVRLRVDDLTTAPAFFDFVYRIVADFEGHQEAEVDPRYLLLPHRWASSFGEMYRAVDGRTVLDLFAGSGGATAKLSGDVVLQFGSGHVLFGRDPQALDSTAKVTLQCRKNIEMEPCTLDFVKSVAVGKQITSAGDFGAYLEVGLDRRFNLGFHEAGFHLISTENPIEDHCL